MAMRDGDLLAAFFASVDSRIWRADSALLDVWSGKVSSPKKKRKRFD